MVSNLRDAGRTIHAGVILTKGVTELLDVAPFEIFAEMNGSSIKMLNFPPEMINDAVDLEVHWVTEDGDVAQMKSGMSIKPSDSFATCPPLDIVLMGAHHPGYHITEGEKAFIQKSWNDCSAFLSICGGIFSLLEANLLDGLTAAAPRMTVDLMRKTVPTVNWVDQRWSRDGKLWSSSSLLNGTDLMRAFVTEVWGGRHGFVEALLDSGHWPDRNVDFKDFNGQNFAVEQF